MTSRDEAAPASHDAEGVICDRLHAFVDGELDDAAHARFRDHLTTCAACRDELPRLLAFVDVIARSAPSGGTQAPSTPLDAGPGGPNAHRRTSRARGPFQGGGAGASEARPHSRRRRRRRLWLISASPGRATAGAAAAISLAAAAVLAVNARHHEPAPASIAGAMLGSTRPFEARLAYERADEWRAYTPTRGAADAGRDEPSFDQLAALERRHDWRGIAVARLLGGDLPGAKRSFERVGTAPEEEIDRAALELQLGDRASVSAALVRLDAVIDGNPDRFPAARWNRAMVLLRLDLPFRAAEELERVAAAGEPGWSDEARERAAALRRDATSRRESWQKTLPAGEALISNGTPIPDAMAAEHPGIVRLYFYDAVRAAPSRARVLALLPLADALDRISGGASLHDYATRVASADFERRAPLAARYTGIALSRAPLTAAEHDAYLGELRRAGAGDILLGVLFREHGARQDTEYRALAEATRDPWFRAIAEQRDAEREIAGGAWLRAETRLRAAIDAARGAHVDYRAVLLEAALADLEFTLHRLPEARMYGYAGLERANASGDWGHRALLLGHLARIERLGNEAPLARAHLEELLAARSPGDCATERFVHASLGYLRLLKLDVDGARRELDATPSCNEPMTLQTAAEIADLARFDRDPAEGARLREALRELRRAGGLSPAERAMADQIEGRLVVETDRAEGEALLRSAIAGGDRKPLDPLAARARGYAYSVLALTAGREGDWDRVIATLAEEIGVDPPARCAVAVAAEDERAVVAVRAPDGATRGTFERSRGVVDAPPAVRADLLESLAACPAIDVLARPPWNGVPDVLPPTLAWRYRVQGAPAGSVPVATSPPQRLVVSRVAAPVALGLTPLPAWTSAADTVPVREIHGPDATPPRVLDAMRSATEIDLHTHGLVDLGISDVSHLVLAPAPDGEYALTAASVASQRLAGAPLVILAACHTTAVAPYGHETWSLPAAFRRAGARAVLASPTLIPDAEAAPFFDAVRLRIRRGETPAAALRDERMARVSTDPSSWTKTVIVFE